MNVLFVAIVMLGIILLVMLCNSNKDHYGDPPDPRRYNSDVSSIDNGYLASRPSIDLHYWIENNRNYGALPPVMKNMIDKYAQLDNNEQCRVRFKVQSLFHDKHGGSAPTICPRD